LAAQQVRHGNNSQTAAGALQKAATIADRLDAAAGEQA
jgi:hypothetical protein